jgi:hypothetical protein
MATALAARGAVFHLLQFNCYRMCMPIARRLIARRAVSDQHPFERADGPRYV